MKRLNIFTCFILLLSVSTLSVVAQEAKAGKIWLQGTHLFVVAPNKGVWFYDNGNPSNPKHMGFLHIPGNVDIAVNGNIMYANNYDDLVSIDITDFENIQVQNRLSGLFLNRKSPSNSGNKSDSAIKWVAPDTDVGDVSGMLSMGGSFSCFAVGNNRLYGIDNENINVINISNPKNMIKEKSVYVDKEIETVFNHNNKTLFIGGKTGMYAFSLSDPSSPNRIAPSRKSEEFEELETIETERVKRDGIKTVVRDGINAIGQVFMPHIRSNDPVVVSRDGQFAYVTLFNDRPDSPGNELQIIDISDINSPKLLKRYALHSPRGLGLTDDGKMLFVCDAKKGTKGGGIKVYDTANPKRDIKPKSFLSFASTYDVIVGRNNVLIITGLEKIQGREKQVIYHCRFNASFELQELSRIEP